MLSVFAAFAAVAFAAAYAGPLGGALVRAQAEEVPSVTLYSAASGDSQTFETDQGEAVPVDLDRGSYVVYVTPKPTPTPTPSATRAPGGSADSRASGAPQQNAAAPRPQYTGGGSKQEWMDAAGIAEGDRGYVDYVVSRESGWNPNATNRSSGACGLVQALPCSKVPGNGYDPVDNLRWATGYAVGRYGSWANAYSFWISNHWW